MLKKMILTGKWCAKQTFAGWNTQHIFLPKIGFLFFDFEELILKSLFAELVELNFPGKICPDHFQNLLGNRDFEGVAVAEFFNFFWFCVQLENKKYISQNEINFLA